MNETWYSTEQVARFFGVDTRTLQDWRVVSNKGTKRYLPAHIDPVDNRKRVYSLSDITNFVALNRRYKDRVFSRLAENPERYGYQIVEAQPT